MRFIREHVGQPFTVGELCQALSVSPRALELSFRGGLGSSPHDYITDVRIQQAKKLLTDGRDLKLEQVSRFCGFSTPRTFFTAFRRLVGSTPVEYRRCMRGEA